MKIKAQIRIVGNGNKIECIKLIRTIFRLSLLEAKTLFEDRDNGVYFYIYMTPEQFARLVIHYHSELPAQASYIGYQRAEIVEPEFLPCYDFSGICE